jgi:hypothetical protein
MAEGECEFRARGVATDGTAYFVRVCIRVGGGGGGGGGDNSLTDVHNPDAGRTQRTGIVLTEPGADAAAAELIVEAWMKADESL